MEVYKLNLNGLENPSLLIGDTTYRIGKVIHTKNGITTEYEIGEDTPTSSSFAEDSWETINAISTSGLASSTYNIGDEKTISVDGTDYVIQIIGFNHDDLSDESGKAGITCQFKNCLASTYGMNSDNINAGGWEQCQMRTYLSGTVLPTLPTDLQSVIKSVNKLTSAGDRDSTYKSTADGGRLCKRPI